MDLLQTIKQAANTIIAEERAATEAYYVGDNPFDYPPSFWEYVQDVAPDISAQFGLSPEIVERRLYKILTGYETPEQEHLAEIMEESY